MSSDFMLTLHKVDAAGERVESSLEGSSTIARSAANANKQRRIACMAYLQMVVIQTMTGEHNSPGKAPKLRLQHCYGGCSYGCRSRKRERADYSAPVSFVSKGTAGSAEQAPKDEVRCHANMPEGGGMCR
eukprot:1155962-Pelagomonas_calceolata.AAC.12